jgi:hypothetical protein
LHHLLPAIFLLFGFFRIFLYLPFTGQQTLGQEQKILCHLNLPKQVGVLTRAQNHLESPAPSKILYFKKAKNTVLSQSCPSFYPPKQTPLQLLEQAWGNP